MCRVLGDLLEEGVVVKLADDLYCGGNSVRELQMNFKRVLSALHDCGLRLFASKTTVAPVQTNILGWIWRLGTLKASPHRIATLSTCPPPERVSGLRSFIGATKVLSRVIPSCSSLIAPPDTAIAGKDSCNQIEWSDDLLVAFKRVQDAISAPSVIHLPRPSDTLWIVTDGAVKNHGIGATMYLSREGELLLGGFFSAKLRGLQASWIACILTDSRPCVLAFEKLCRGEFSVSPCVSTFLSVVSRYQMSIRHVKGSAILPSDFASRNAAECRDEGCQVCSFVQQTEECVVRNTSMSVDDVLDGSSKLPFTTRSTWRTIQSECPDLRRTCVHLRQGTRPSKKIIDIRDVKRYLRSATLAPDGLLVVKKDIPFSPSRQCTIVPRHVLHGLLMSLHIRLNHPSSLQLLTVVNRYFYALDMEQAVQSVSFACFQCAALRQVPKTRSEQSSSDTLEAVGISFAADVMRRERQMIFVLCECATSYTAASIINDETRDTLRETLLMLCVALRPLDGPPAVVRTDPAPGFQALSNDEVLKQHRIAVEIGRVKNVNKNPVAERAIQELEDEILRMGPLCKTVTPVSLSLAVSALNSKIRSRGLSSREMMTHRDQFTNEQLPVSDRLLIEQQHANRADNHGHSARSKAPLKIPAVLPDIDVGDLVYLFADRNKSQARDRYLVTSTDQLWCNVHKFKGDQLRNASYRVKKSDCYKVPDLHYMSRPEYHDHGQSDDEDETVAFPSDSREEFHPPQSANDMPPDRGLPDIPEQISVPLFDSAESTEAEMDKSALQHTPDVPNSHVSDRPKRRVTQQVL